MAQATTVIAAGTSVSGRIEGAEDLDVFGSVDGAIALDGNINIAEGARLDADVEANVIHVAGIIIGNVTARQSIHLTTSSLVAGDITAPSVILDDGAKYRGHIDMGEDASRSAPPPRPAPARSAAPQLEEDPEPETDDADAPARKKVRVKKRT